MPYFRMFKKKLKIPFHVVTKGRTKNIFNMTVYSKESDINIRKQLDCLKLLFAKNYLSKMSYYPFDVKEVISLRRDYFTTYVFYFYCRKQ